MKEARLPEWLRRERVFSSAELPDEGAGSRRRYRAWMARRTYDVIDLKAGAEQRLGQAAVLARPVRTLPDLVA